MTGTLLVTSNLVIGETHTLLRTAKGYRQAKRFLDALGYSRKMERLFITEYLERKAHAILEQYADHSFSFVDGTSFALMRQQRMQHAFAFDAHFVTAGFLRIPRKSHESAFLESPKAPSECAGYRKRKVGWADGGARWATPTPHTGSSCSSARRAEV